MAPQEAPPSDNLYITELPAGSDDNLVRQLFEQYGSVSSVRVLQSATPGSKIAALVRFGSVAEAQWVRDNVGGNIPEGLAEPVKIRYADTPETKAARQSGSWKGKAEGKGGWGGGDDGSWGAGKGWGVTQRAEPYSNGKASGKGDKGKGKGKGGWGKGGFSIRDLFRGLTEAQVLPGGASWNNDEHSLYIAGLPSDTSDLDLYKIFSPFGALQPRGVRAMLQEDGVTCKGIGFVNYLESTSSEAAIMTLHGTCLPDGSQLQVQVKSKPGEKGGKSKGGGKTGATMATPALGEGGEWSAMPEWSEPTV